MREKILGGLETFAKAMVQPLMYLSSAGILMVIGFMSYFIYLITSNTMLTSLDQLAQGSEMLGLIGTGQAKKHLKVLYIYILEQTLVLYVCSLQLFYLV